MLKGIASYSGIAIGKVHRFIKPDLEIKAQRSDEKLERVRFNNALAKVESEIVELLKECNDDSRKILEAQLAMCSDPEYLKRIGEILSEGFNAEYAVRTLENYLIAIINNSDSSYFRERSLDIKEFSERLLYCLLDLKIDTLEHLDKDFIIVANNLSSVDILKFNDHVKGFLCAKGGKTSHVAILASSMCLPGLLAVDNLLESVKDDDLIIIDSFNSRAFINPDDKTIYYYQKLKEELDKKEKELEIFIDKETSTKDKHHLELSANVSILDDVYNAYRNGSDSVGLMRTEFLYMNEKDDFPSEDKQFETYKKALERFKDKRVVIRTLDIGGDKSLNYYKFPKERNPFLGYRAIRFSLDKDDVFRTQLRALLKASRYGKLAIMFPMVSSLEEFRMAKAILNEEKEKLLNEGFVLGDEVEVGLMIEVPSVAFMADELAKEADFFSIGTNDLIQYMMAVDRLSEDVSYLYQPLNPAMLRILKMIVEAAHRHHIWCGMCGEMVNDELSLPLLLGLDLDELSTAVPTLLSIRKRISELNYEECKKLFESALKLDNINDIKELIKNYYNKNDEKSFVHI